ncbi:MAG TPA: ABC transporter substrate-binding protein [Kofleriaceae bacterium]
MRPSWLLGALLVTSLAASACKGDKQDTGKQDTAKPGGGGGVRVGVVTSLTGSQAAFGQAHKNGYAIARDEINAKGGVLGKPLEIVFYDDQSKSAQAGQGVAKLVDQDHVPLILGSFSSDTTRAMLPPVMQKQVPLIMPTATADNVMATGSPWIFRLCAGATDYARSTIGFLKDNGAPKTLALVYESTNFGQANAEAMKKVATEAGMTVVDDEPYQPTSPDYKALLQRVKATNPEVVYYASYLLDAVTLMRQAQELDFNPKFITSAGTGFSVAEFPTADKGAGKYAEYTYSVAQWTPTAKWAGSKEFDEAFFKLTKTHPAYHATEAYVALLVAADAINRAKSAEPKAIADAIRATKLDTAFGPIQFDAKGQNAHPVLITQVQSGQYKLIWPSDSAESKPLPMPPWSERH